MLDDLRFDRDGLIPVIVQEHKTNNVLLLAYMNTEALQRTLDTRLAHFWSRSRQKLWQKGETSGHVQEVVSLHINCEGNSLLLQVRQRGEAACHDGYRSCYYRQLNDAGAWVITQPRLFDPAEVYAHPASGGPPVSRSAGILPAQSLADENASPSAQPPSRSAGILPAHPSADTTAHNSTQSANTPPNQTEQEISLRARGYLPHWEQKGATYFVTFRLANALPAQTLLAFEGERAALLKKQGSTHELSADEKKRLDELLSDRIQGYLDIGAGSCHLANPAVAQIVANTLHHFNGTRYQLFCWCIMPNHVHVIVRPFDSHTLVSILHSWKSFTTLEANRLLGSKGNFWQREYYDHLIRDEQDFLRLVEYVVNNPVKAHLENWQWVKVYDTYPRAGAESSAGMSRQDAGATGLRVAQNANVSASQAIGRLEAGATETLAEAFQRIYHAYEYLRDHDLEAVSGTSRRLRHPDLAWLRQRAAQELGELAGVLDSTHVHTTPAADTILEGRQVCYWLLLMAAAIRLPYNAIEPHEHLLAGFESGENLNAATIDSFAHMSGEEDAQAIRAYLQRGLQLVGGACCQQGVSLTALAQAELADLHQKSYLPPEVLS